MAKGGRAERRGPGASAAGRSGFVRLTELLTGAEPGKPPINLSVGEPHHAMPAFVGPILTDNLSGFGRYPMTRGTESFRIAVAYWLNQRYRLARAVDPASEVIVLNGSREGLFLAAIAARRFVGPRRGKPAILFPNPFYMAYFAGAEAAGCEPVALPATRATGFLPDYDALSDELLDRTVAIYLCSPANPQGAVLSSEALARLLERARAHGALIFADECYSEIWLKNAPPPGILEVAGKSFDGILSFNSLSKRSSLPGLRCGFAAGDPRFLAAYMELRNVAAPQVPQPIQEVAVAAYGDESHVEENRRLYRAKFDLADDILGARFHYRRPDGGFFLWLDVTRFEDDETAALELWRDSGLRVVPGSYLAHEAPDGSNPGAGYVRAALVDDLKTTEAALRRLVEFYG
ncbi:MAG: aminotransferase class I/II-fold pyridoxal phosphate-dependent enzyme [Xanthobacteraceae bacterium]